MAKAAIAAKPAAQFRTAIEAAEHLELKAGLRAIKKGEGRGRIFAEQPAGLLGSAVIDDDCRVAFPQANRWDYVIGYGRSTQAVAHFVEVHSAESSNVSEMAKKLEWLRGFLLRDRQKKLAALTREYHWVASGRINIPKHVPQYRQLQTTLRSKGLRGPVTRLTLT